MTLPRVKHSYRLSIIIVLLALTFLMVATTAEYGRRQAEVSLEANDLHTAERIDVTSTLVAVRADLGPHGDYVASLSLPEFGRVRAVSGGRLASAPFPVHAGRSFRDDDSGVALVGSHVAVTHRGDVEFVEVNGRAYPVVGHLGQQPASLVQDEIVVADATLFPTHPAHLSVDGPDAEKLVDRYGPMQARRAHQGTTRRTGIDQVSPLIISLSTILAVLCSGFLGIAWGIVQAPHSRIARLVGHAHTRTTLRLLAPLALAVVLMFALGTIATGPKLALAAAAFSCLACSTAVLLHPERRPR